MHARSSRASPQYCPYGIAPPTFDLNGALVQRLLIPPTLRDGQPRSGGRPGTASLTEQTRPGAGFGGEAVCATFWRIAEESWLLGLFGPETRRRRRGPHHRHMRLLRERSPELSSWEHVRRGLFPARMLHFGCIILIHLFQNNTLMAVVVDVRPVNRFAQIS